MVNYQNSFIYKLCCKDLTIQDIYIGSTTNFKQRKRQHKNCTTKETNKNYNRTLYKFIRDNGDWDNWDMRESYEEYKPSLNYQVPSRSKKEYQKQFDSTYYERNKEKVKKKRMERYYNNKV